MENCLTQKEIDELFRLVRILRRAKGRELTKKEIENCIYYARRIAQD